jgi:hypothetical protein
MKNKTWADPIHTTYSMNSFLKALQSTPFPWLQAKTNKTKTWARIAENTWEETMWKETHFVNLYQEVPILREFLYEMRKGLKELSAFEHLYVWGYRPEVEKKLKGNVVQVPTRKDLDKAKTAQLVGLKKEEIRGMFQGLVKKLGGEQMNGVATKSGDWKVDPRVAFLLDEALVISLGICEENLKMARDAVRPCPNTKNVLNFMQKRVGEEEVAELGGGKWKVATPQETLDAIKECRLNQDGWKEKGKKVVDGSLVLQMVGDKFPLEEEESEAEKGGKEAGEGSKKAGKGGKETEEGGKKAGEGGKESEEGGEATNGESGEGEKSGEGEEVGDIISQPQSPFGGAMEVDDAILEYHTPPSTKRAADEDLDNTPKKARED